MPPDELVWHYTDGAGLLGILTDHVLWATASEFLNDNAEVRLGASRIAAELHESAEAGDPLARLLRSRTRDAETGDGGPSPSTFFILSAARHWDLLAMWRTYGGLGESYAVGLDPTAPLLVLTDEDAALPAELLSSPAAPDDAATADVGYVRQRPWAPVRYGEQEQRQLARAVFDGFGDDVAEARRRLVAGSPTASVVEAMASTLDDVEQALVLIKHPGFMDEREVRHSTSLLHRSGLDGWRGVVRYRPTRYGIAPHLWLTGSTPDATGAGAGGHAALTTSAAPLPIREVAISPSANGRAATASLAALLAARGYDVPVRRSSIPFRG
jgi:hypothetical protein